MKAYNCKVVSAPKQKKASLFLKVKVLESNETIDAVAFYKDLDSEFLATLVDLKVDDSITFTAKKKFNDYLGKNELVITGELSNEDAKYAINPSVDFEVGGLSSYNGKPIIYVEKEDGKLSYYTDGDYSWYKDHPGVPIKCPAAY